MFQCRVQTNMQVRHKVNWYAGEEWEGGGGQGKESREGGGGLTAWDWHVEAAAAAAGVDLVLGRANGTINSHDN